MAADDLAPFITALINKNIGILFPVSRRPNRIAQYLVMVNFERHLTYLRKMKLELSTHHLKAEEIFFPRIVSLTRIFYSSLKKKTTRFVLTKLHTFSLLLFTFLT